VAVVSNRHSHRRWLWRATRRRAGSHERELPMYSRSYRSWRCALEERGFDACHEEGMCWMPFSRESNSRWIGPMTTAERVLGLRKLRVASPWVGVVMRRR
jgi:hypothetical protein